MRAGAFINNTSDLIAVCEGSVLLGLMVMSFAFCDPALDNARVHPCLEPKHLTEHLTEQIHFELSLRSGEKA